jgi:hypothetical protein
MSETVLLAREQEQRALEDVLKRRHPAVVIIAGTVGSGKTTLLRWAHARANELGWSTVPADSGQELSVGEETEPEAFLARVVPQATEDSSTFAPTTASGDDGIASADAMQTWQLLLLHRGPVSVFLDGFAPSDGFAAWLADSLLPQIRAHSLPVALLVAVESADTPAARALHADTTIELGPLAPEVIREHIESTVHGLGLDVGPHEMETYVRHLSVRPELLQGLIRLLTLTRPQGQKSTPRASV